MAQHWVVVAVHVVYLELLQAHVVGQSLKKLVLFSEQDITAFEGELLYWWVGVSQGKDLASTNADQLCVVATVYEFVIKSIRRVDDMLKTDERKLIFGEANCMHRIADLVHHVAHLLILEIRFIYN